MLQLACAEEWLVSPKHHSQGKGDLVYRLSDNSELVIENKFIRMSHGLNAAQRLVSNARRAHVRAQAWRYGNCWRLRLDAARTVRAASFTPDHGLVVHKVWTRTRDWLCSSAKVAANDSVLLPSAAGAVQSDSAPQLKGRGAARSDEAASHMRPLTAVPSGVPALETQPMSAAAAAVAAAAAAAAGLAGSVPPALKSPPGMSRGAGAMKKPVGLKSNRALKVRAAPLKAKAASIRSLTRAVKVLMMKPKGSALAAQKSRAVLSKAASYGAQLAGQEPTHRPGALRGREPASGKAAVSSRLAASGKVAASVAVGVGPVPSIKAPSPSQLAATEAQQLDVDQFLCQYLKQEMAAVGCRAIAGE